MTLMIEVNEMMYGRHWHRVGTRYVLGVRQQRYYLVPLTDPGVGAGGGHLPPPQQAFRLRGCVTESPFGCTHCLIPRDHPSSILRSWDLCGARRTLEQEHMSIPASQKGGELPTNIHSHQPGFQKTLKGGYALCLSLTSHPTPHSNLVPRKKLGALELPTAPVTTEKLHLRWGHGYQAWDLVTERPHSSRTMAVTPTGWSRARGKGTFTPSNILSCWFVYLLPAEGHLHQGRDFYLFLLTSVSQVPDTCPAYTGGPINMHCMNLWECPAYLVSFFILQPSRHLWNQSSWPGDMRVFSRSSAQKVNLGGKRNHWCSQNSRGRCMAVHQSYGALWTWGRWNKEKREAFIMWALTQDPSELPTAATSTLKASHFDVSHDSAHADFNHTPSTFFLLSIQKPACLPRHILSEASLIARDLINLTLHWPSNFINRHILK